MIITHKIMMDLDRYSVPGFDAVCGDRYTRELEIALFAGGTAWEPPAGSAVTVRYQKPDGTTGSYDLLPDGTDAWEIRGNVVTVMVAPQALTVPGCVILTVCLTAGDREISTFQILMNVRPAVGMVESESGDYWYLSGSLPQPKNAVVGEVLVVDSVDSQGRVTGLKTAGAPGISMSQINALEALLKLAAYTEDPSGAWEAFQAAFGQEGVSVPATGITLSAASLSFTDTAARMLTAVLTPGDTTDILAWTTSDPAVARVSGGLVTPVGDGKCTITATAGAVSASCSVTVSGISDPVHTHNYISAVTAAATCTTSGVRTYTCSCGDSYTETIAATGHHYVDGVCANCGAADPDTEVDATLTSISVTYSGGSVTVGTSVDDLTGIVVTAVYSDGSTAVVTDYTLSGTIAEGSNTVTVSYGGKTATFTVTGIEKFYDIEWVQKTGYYKNGVLTQFNGVYNTGLVAVGSATKLYFKFGRNANYYIGYFDAAGTYISQSADWWTAGTRTFTFPDGAAYFAAAYYLDDLANIEIRVNANEVRHLITSDLVAVDRGVTNVIDGSGYTAALTSAATAVTMGGVDITGTAYADGVVTIASVTGDVVIA